MTERLHLMVDDDVPALMAQLAGGERRRGQWLGNLVRALHEQDRMGQGSDLELLRHGFNGLASSVKVIEGRLEGRLMRVEQQVAALVADGQKVAPSS